MFVSYLQGRTAPIRTSFNRRNSAIGPRRAERLAERRFEPTRKSARGCRTTQSPKLQSARAGRLRRRGGAARADKSCRPMFVSYLQGRTAPIRTSFNRRNSAIGPRRAERLAERRFEPTRKSARGCRTTQSPKLQSARDGRLCRRGGGAGRKKTTARRQILFSVSKPCP